MNRAGAFCPRCGDPVDPDSVSDASTDPRGESSVPLCTSCYVDDFELIDVPDRIVVRVCPRCGAVHRGNQWVDVGAVDYTDVAVDAVSEVLTVHVDATDVTWQVEPEEVDPTAIRLHCEVSGRVRETAVTESFTVPVAISRETCTRCGRIAGEYYASVVQVRATDRTPTTGELERAESIAHSIVESMESTGDRDAFVTDATRSADGLDIKVSTTNIGRKIAAKIVEEFGGDVSDSETLVTEDEDGNPVYRVTYAVRLPPFTPGDVIELENEDVGPVLVRSAHGNLKGVTLTDGDRYEASYEEGTTPDARKLGNRSDAERTTVVTVEDDHAVQVLDPETARAVTVARPSYFDPDADEVPVLRSRAGLHILPEDDG